MQWLDGHDSFYDFQLPQSFSPGYRRPSQGFQQVKEPLQGLQQVKEPLPGLRQVKGPFQGLQQVMGPFQWLQQVKEPFQGLQQVKGPFQGLQLRRLSPSTSCTISLAKTKYLSFFHLLLDYWNYYSIDYWNCKSHLLTSSPCTPIFNAFYKFAVFTYVLFSSPHNPHLLFLISALI